MAPKKRKTRVAFRKNRGKRGRVGQNLTDAYKNDEVDSLHSGERISGKGDLTRHRTIIQDDETDSDDPVSALVVDEQACRWGRVIYAVGANQCLVEDDEQTRWTCSVRRRLRTLLSETRSTVVAGDRVQFLPVSTEVSPPEGVIEKFAPRKGVLSRGSRRSQHVIVSNIEQAVIVVAAVEPHFKPALIDRFLVSCEKGGVQPIICINKIDLVHPIEFLRYQGRMSQLGYPVFLTSAQTGEGMDQLRHQLLGRETVFSGQSGVGKSSLLNSIDENLKLRTQNVSHDSGKGTHTTRTAELIKLSNGGWVVDTPGIRQMQLWDVQTVEVEGFFIEFRPYVIDCRFPDCSHTHEEQCGIKHAVERGAIAIERYESYLRMLNDEED